MPRGWGRNLSDPSVWWFDGRLIESDGSGASLPARFGKAPPCVDGLHEAIRVRDGRCEFAAEHIERLTASAGALEIPLAFDRSALMDALLEVVRANPSGDLFARLYVVRSAGTRIETLAHTGHAARPMSEGFRLAIAASPRDERSPLVHHKTMSDGAVRLALAAAHGAGMDEAIFLNRSGRIAGAARANIHMISHMTLVTPSIEEGAFPGIVRGAVLRAARDIGLAVEERGIEPGELLLTSEVFLTSTFLGLAPVAEVEGAPLPSPTRSPAIPRLRVRYREIAGSRGIIP